MSDEQNLVYECSRQNASVKISNSEWVNEWSDGIQLNRGDQVRLLGSFISEVGDGNDISISEDTKFTMDFKPYINGETVNFGSATHADIAGSFQIKLGDIAQPAYYTDNLGTEPPFTTPKLVAQNKEPNFADNAGRLASDRYSYRKDYGQHAALPYLYPTTDDARKAGCFIDTASGTANLTAADITDEKLVKGTLSAFNQINVSEEFHLGHLCKLLRFPMFGGVRFEETEGNYINKDFRSDDILNVGDYIATYHIGDYPIVLQGAASAVYTLPGNDTFGNVKWEAGPQSVVGKIVAIKYEYKTIYEPIDNISAQMEFCLCYVQDFINPGQYKHQNDKVGTSTIPRHGAPELRNGYNTFRNNNQLNGFLSAQNNGGVFTGLNQTPLADVSTYYTNLMSAFNLAGNSELAGNVVQSQNLLGNSNAGLSFLWGSKGGFQLQDYNMFDLSQPPFIYNLEGFQSWVNYQAALTGLIEDGLTTNQLPITIGDDFIIISSTWDFQTVRTSKFNVGSPLYTGPNPADFIGNCHDIEAIQYQEGFFTPNQPYYYRLTLSGPIGAGHAIGTINFHFQHSLSVWRFMPKQFNWTMNEQDGGGNTQITHPASGLWKDVGGIVKMNPDNDNVAYDEPAAPFFKRFFIPYAEQAVKSPYETRNLGGGTWGAPGFGGNYAVNAAGVSAASIGDRMKHTFGCSGGWLGGGDFRSAANRTIPFPYGLANTCPFLNYQFNMYNEQVSSVYFQNETGNGIFPQATDDNDKVNNIAWKQDLIYIKKYKVEFNIPAGFYNPDRMAEIINDQLHYDTEEYYKKVGTNSSVGSRERALTDGNNVIHGNFLHSYIPELSFGILPMTTSARTELNNPQHPYTIFDNMNQFFYNYSDPSNPNLVDGNNISDYYTVPYNAEADGTLFENFGSTYCFRLIGSRILQTAAGNQMSNINPSKLFNNRQPMVLASDNGMGAGHPLGTPEPGYVWYQNRGYKNTLMYGGAAKCWVGAVNPTFQFSSDELIFSWSYLYTPYRPAADESGNVLTLTGGEAVPSAIINTTGSGEITESLSGVYILSLNSNQISATNTPQFFDMFQNGYPTPILDYVSKSTNFWNTLGFSTTLLNSYGDRTGDKPYIFISANSICGNVLRNQAEVDISSNGSNPLKSYCSLWAPPVQYAVICESNFKYADSKPRYGNTPFYLIGSSFPTKEYYGGKGTKLPVIGVCSRQFSSFGFAFDLSESAITYTINEDVFLTSIRTKIYNNDFTIPQNLDDNSSVIYVIQKNSYYSEPPEEVLEEANKIILKENAPINYNASMFETMPQAYVYEAPLYLIETDDEDEF